MAPVLCAMARIPREPACHWRSMSSPLHLRRSYIHIRERWWTGLHPSAEQSRDKSTQKRASRHRPAAVDAHSGAAACTSAEHRPHAPPSHVSHTRVHPVAHSCSTVDRGVDAEQASMGWSWTAVNSHPLRHPVRRTSTAAMLGLYVLQAPEADKLVARVGSLTTTVHDTCPRCLHTLTLVVYPSICPCAHKL